IVLALDNEDDDSLITVTGNRYLLSIALSNLIDNNCKYSDNHTSVVQISAGRDGNVVIRLSDTGGGIPDSERDKIFTLFYRGGNDKGVKGYGIGMSLALKIIRLHNGSLDVLSYPGEGTTFVVGMPHL
ncbi:MAG: two-component sensor histidine kinase, partial [Muribaculaceae bacterium]|nr:two-component sensor histidine kinase [Muribaculaceae bacterium]